MRRPMTAFTLPIKILFQHCDPAGIVFYPRYFEMVNQTVEEWFERELAYSFADMQGPDGRGVPTVTISTDFKAVSRLGEVVEFTLRVLDVGRTSLALEIVGTCGAEERMRAKPVLVFMDKATGRPVPWKDDTRHRMQRFMAAAAE
jgi:4-hydroxybenzoyl-CoA thioesterase